MKHLIPLIIWAIGAVISTGAALASEIDASQLSLKDSFSNDFLVGTALSKVQIMGERPGALALASREFNAVTPENDMKWERIQPLEGEFDWTSPDALVEFALGNGMFLTGHTLIWHQQTPPWVFENGNGGPASREQLLSRMETHINTVVGRYKGRVQSWDVVNEALNEDGSLRESPWYKIIGEDYIAKAFEFAHKADPDAELYYNDYNMFRPDKRDGAVRLVKALQDKGITLHGVGMQAHYGLDNPKDMQEFDDAIAAYSELGVSVHVTELDLSVLPFPDSDMWGADLSLDLELEARYNPYADGIPVDVEKAQTEQYLKIFGTLLKYRDSVARVTFWGLTDGSSWKNGWPMQGRTDYPLFFDRNYKPKPMYFEVIELTTEQ